MDVIYPRCAGLDVHKQTVVACVRIAELMLANAAHVKNVPGRKTDVNDAMWLADLLAHGFVRASLVPPVAVQELRTLKPDARILRERGQH